MSESTSPVIRREVTVPTGVERAFAIFTERFGEVKPLEHNLLEAPLASTTFEPRVGGHVFDTATDGSECRFADVLVYEPPHRVVFTWNIGPDWRLVADPANASEVEVTFTPLGADETRLVLEHRHLERHGPGWEGLLGALDSGEGWPLYVERYESLARSV